MGAERDAIMRTIVEKNLGVLQLAHPRLHEISHQKTYSKLNVALECRENSAKWFLGDQTGEYPHGSDIGFDGITSHTKLCVLYGLGDADFLDRLRKQTAVENILVFEPSEASFLSLIEQKEVKDILSDVKIQFIIGTDSNTYLNQIEQYFYSNIERFCQSANHLNLITPGVQSIQDYKPYFLHFAQSFKNAVNNVLARGEFSKEDSYFGFKNFLSNTTLFKEMAVLSDRIKDFEDVPVAVVATGPSLAASIDALKSVQDRMLIVACDSAASILKENGIAPDFVCGLERCVESQKFVNDREVRSEAFVVPTVVYPKTLRNFKGPRYFMLRDTGFDSILNHVEDRKYFLGQTVSQMALRVAHVVSGGPIYLIGVDCAFDPHTDSSHHESAASVLKEGHDWVKDESGLTVTELPGHDGKPKKTWSIWMMDLQIMANMVHTDQMQVFRVTPLEYGIPIAGVSRVEPNALLDISTPPIDDKSQIVLAHSTGHQGKIRFERQDLEKLGKDLSDLSARAIQILDEMTVFYFNHRPFLRENHDAYDDYFIQIDRERRELVDSCDDCYRRALHNILQGQYAKTGYRIFEIRREKKRAEEIIDDSLAVYREWFSSVAVWASRLNQEITRHLTRHLQ